MASPAVFADLPTKSFAQIATACRPSDAVIGAEPKVSGSKGDVMSYDVNSAVQSQNNLRRHQEYAGQWGASYYEQMIPKTEMLIGDWYVDEFGNRSREIKARDAEEEVLVRAQPERRNRTQIRTAAARLAQLAAI